MFAKLITTCLLSVTLSTPLLSPPDLLHYHFVPSESRLLPGKTPENKLATIGTNQDSIGRLALVSLKYHTNYWVDGRYNHTDFPVEIGRIQQTGSDLQLDAFRISEPLHKATKFLGSQHGLYYRFPEKADWSLYQLDQNGIQKVVSIPADQIVPEQYSRLDGVTVSKLSGSATYALARSASQVSNYTQLNQSVEAARIAATPLGDLLLYRFPQNGTPPDPHQDKPTLTSRFFLLKGTRGPAVIWQDTITQEIRLTRFSDDLLHTGNITLPLTRAGRLFAACSDPAGNIYYLIARTKEDPEKLELFKAAPDGTLLAHVVPDTSITKLNVFSMGAEAAALAWSDNKLCMLLMRTMHTSPDGLNHQGGIATIFNAQDLTMIKHLGQTSGHSFDNVLHINEAGEFIAIDLGDNYPRGIHLHKLSDKKKISRVVYTFKTEHGGTQISRSGKTTEAYPDISTLEKTYFKWSNDNRTYTELGGIIETPKGYMILFAGEPSPDGKVLDNSRSGAKSPDMRNLGLVIAVKQFQQIPNHGSVIPDELLLSKGPAENGGFYNFRGGWTQQRATGVVWLTRYTAAEGISARHIKTASLADGNILVLWETIRNGKHHGNWVMTVSPEGAPFTVPCKLPDLLSLNRRDAVMVDGKRAYIASGDSRDRRLELFILQLH